ncbi:hypothetical protein [Campylobacter sp. CCS1377]|uniref:Collagen-like protein n=1 Tax=Campylobacter sp. CCS1377 TaxID=3158229 RepID=A0AAU7E717_9BACT
MSLEQVINTQNASLEEIIINLNALVELYKAGGINEESVKRILSEELAKLNLLQFSDISDEQNPNRKSLQLKNHDSISGFLKDGQSAVNIAMVSKWDKVDFGSSSVEMNLNSKDGIVKINDDKIIATMANLDELKGLISDENLNAKITSLIEAMKDELKGEKGDKGETGPAGPKGDIGEVGPKGDKGDKGDTPSKEELSPIISEVLQGMEIDTSITKEKLEPPLNEILSDNEKQKSIKNAILENCDLSKSLEGAIQIPEDKINEAVEKTAKPMIEQTLSQVANMQGNVMSAFINAVENKTLLCNITNTDVPALSKDGLTGYKQGFVWVNESISPQKIWVSDVTSWKEVILSDIKTIDKLAIKVSRNKVAVAYNACAFANFGLIKQDGTAIFAKSSTITNKGDGSETCVFEIEGVDYTATLTCDLGIYSGNYTFNIVNGNNASLLSKALSDDGLYHYTLTFDKALPNNIKGFGVRPYANSVTRDWTPKMILEAYNKTIEQPIFSLTKTYTENTQVDKQLIHALNFITGEDLSKKVKSYNDWTQVE